MVQSTNKRLVGTYWGADEHVGLVPEHEVEPHEGERGDERRPLFVGDVARSGVVAVGGMESG